MKDQLQAAMKEIDALNKSDGVDMKGKKYTTVAMRVEVFRKHFPDYSVNTRVTVDDGKRVIVVAEIYPPGAERPIATGIAEEIRGSTNVNRTSAVENCATSSVGRALAVLGLHGGEFASDFEIDLAKQNGATMDMNEAIQAAKEAEQEEDEVMQDLQQASDDFPDEEAEGTSNKNDDIFQSFVDRMVKEFKFAKSIGQMNAVFAKEQANYKRLKAERPAMALIIADAYEQKERKLDGKN
tara:strand:+ start:232 stop:948 length:717 start_codon:yes stop_codon:yes gene_type:complete